MTTPGRTATDSTGNEPPPTAERLSVSFEGETYPAEPVAKGAAFEIFATQPVPGFLRNPRPGARKPFRRFVPSVDVEVLEGQAPEPPDRPLFAPLGRSMSWPTVHRLSQRSRTDRSELIARIRHSVVISRGTRMVKVLSPRQLAGHLTGWLPQGFCYREFDVAHLRTPADLSVLRSDGEDGGADAPVVFLLRWRAVDPLDYEIPFGTSFSGLIRMPPRDRIGPPVLGTGFAPSDQQVIPEYVTAHLADLPLTAFAELVAYTDDGTEVVLYSYLPEQRAWTRMFGPQWRSLFSDVPVAPEQEYFSMAGTPTKLVGRHGSHEFEAIADPPGEFRVLAKTRAARYPVETLARRTPYVQWRGVTCTMIRNEGDWLRIRLIRPDGDSVSALGASCVERGIYETWAPRADILGPREVDVRYDIAGPPAPPAAEG